MKENVFALFIKKIKGNNSILSNTGWLLMEKAIRMTVGFFVGIWIARYLGPDKFGELSYSTALVTIVTGIAPLGLVGYIVKEFVKNPSEKNVILGTTFFSRLLSGIFLYLLLIVVAIILNPNDLLIISIVMIIGLNVILQSFDSIDLYFQSEVKSKYNVMSKSLALIFVSLLNILFILKKMTLIYFAVSLGIEAIIGAGFLLFFLSRQGMKVTDWKFDFKLVIQYLKKTWPLIFSSMAAVLYLKIDQVMLREMTSDSEVGIYSAAVKLSEVWYFLPVAFVTSFFPSLVKVSRIDSDGYKRKLQKLFDFLFILALVPSIAITFLAGYLINLTYGDEFLGASLILTLHIWTAIFVFMRALLSKWLINEDLMLFSFVSHGLGAIANLLLNFILIPKLGGIGASVATIVSYSISTYFFCFLSPKTIYVGKMMTNSLFLPLRGLIYLFRKKVTR
jgi:O-antigen/teichoic acid export membrane protein